MKLYDLKTSGICEPVGYALSPLSLSWKVKETEGKEQASARVLISLCPSFSETVYDSGERKEIDSLAFHPELTLKPGTRYYWKVRVIAENGDAAEAVSFFETGRAKEPWSGKWITSPVRQNMLLHRRFTVAKPVKSARAYATAYGVYELYLGGKKCGDEYLTPYYNGYDSWLQTTAFDLTGLVRQGENEVLVMLGGGWAVSRFGLGNGGENGTRGLYADHPSFLGEIRLLYEDGTEEIIPTDGQWTASESPVRDSSIYDGETFDATFDCSAEQPVQVEEPGYEKVEDRISPPLRITERIRPVKLIRTPKDELVIDLGQEITGWLGFTCRAPRGRKVKLSYSEILQNDCFYRDNLRTALEEYTYISDGTERYVRPYHTFFGFRLVRVEGLSEEEIDLNDFEGCVLHSDLPRTAWVKTANPKVDRFALNALWGQRGNFVDTPTDCPQRDERLGWTGDAQAFSGTACFNMYSRTFFEKYLHDMLYEQNKCGGSCPHVVPDAGMHTTEGSCAWGDAAAVIPWNVYLFYGDKELLRKTYPNMKGWVDWIRRTEEKNGCGRLWKVGFHFADWLALDTKNNTVMGATDPYFIASAYYYYSTSLLLKAARVLDYEEDVKEYSALLDEIGAAIRDEYFTPNGLMAQTTQTAYVCALFMGFAPEQHRRKLAALLDAEITATNGELRTGFVGTAYLNRVLSGNGYNRRAYKLMLNEKYPGWLYEVNMGATTVWERWNSVLPDGSISDTGMNSLNHYAYGSVMEWLYRDAAGINPVEEAPGFRKILIRPRPDYLLPAVSVKYESPLGMVESSWEIRKNEFVWDVQVPFGAEAKLVFPEGDAAALRTMFPGVKEECGEVCAVVKAGTYHIVYRPVHPLHRVISVDLPLRELMEVPEAVRIIGEAVPGFKMLTDNGFVHEGDRSLRALLSGNRGPVGPKLPADILERLEKSLAALN